MTRADLEFGTIPRLVRASAARFPELEGLVDGDLRLTFPELAGRIEETTRAIVESNVLHDAGDRYELSGPLPPTLVPVS